MIVATKSLEPITSLAETKRKYDESSSLLYAVHRDEKTGYRFCKSVTLHKRNGDIERFERGDGRDVVISCSSGPSGINLIFTDKIAAPFDFSHINRVDIEHSDGAIYERRT